MGRTSCTGPLKPKREGRRNVVEGVKKGGYMLFPPLCWVGWGGLRVPGVLLNISLQLKRSVGAEES